MCVQKSEPLRQSPSPVIPLEVVASSVVQQLFRAISTTETEKEMHTMKNARYNEV